MSGYAKAWRSRWEHPVFKDKVEAAVWAWMCDTARWKRHEFATRFGLVVLERGQLLISERQIAEDFRLHKNAVRGLLARLTQANMIALKKDHDASRAGTICTISKYDDYQGDSAPNADAQDQDETIDRTKTGPRRDQDGTTREESKEGEEGEEGKNGEKPIAGSRPAKPSPRDKAKAMALPESILAESWAEWVDYRYELARGKPVPESTLKRSIKKLVDLGEAGHPAPAVIEQSIAKGWRDLFELKGGAVHPLPSKSGLSDDDWRVFVKARSEIGDKAWPPGKCGGPFPGTCPQHILAEFGFGSTNLFSERRRA